MENDDRWNEIQLEDYRSPQAVGPRSEFFKVSDAAFPLFVIWMHDRKAAAP